MVGPNFIGDESVPFLTFQIGDGLDTPKNTDSEQTTEVSDVALAVEIAEPEDTSVAGPTELTPVPEITELARALAPEAAPDHATEFALGGLAGVATGLITAESHPALGMTVAVVGIAFAGVGAVIGQRIRN